MSLPVEIERKFLVCSDAWQALVESRRRIRQGYLSQPGGTTVRVRRKEDTATLTIKGPADGLSRVELEYPIPVDHAEYLLTEVCDRPPVEKLRHRIWAQDTLWVVDVFLGANEGLITAEVELLHAEQRVSLPRWLGREITADPRFHNSSLYREPFSEWHRLPGLIRCYQGVAT